MRSCLGVVSANYMIDGVSVLAQDRAVSAIPFGGRYRLIDFPLSNISNAGISTVAVITPVNNRSLVEHIGIGTEWGFGRKAGGLFLIPGTIFGERLKTSRFLIRDLAKNIDFFSRGDEDYVIFQGSNKIFNIDLKELVKFQEQSPYRATLVYKKTLNDPASGNLNIKVNDKGKITKISNKGNGVVNTFLDCVIIERKYLLDILEWYGVFEDMDIIELMGNHIKKVEIGSYEFTGYVGMIDNLPQYMKTSMDLLNPEIRNDLFNPERRIYTNVQDKQPTLYGKNAKATNSIIAGGCVINGTVENSIVFRSSVVEEGAVVKNSIVMQHGVISMEASLNNVICDKSVFINKAVNIAGGSEKPFVIEKARVL